MSSSQGGWCPHPATAPRPYHHWLTERGSLTRRLQARCKEFSVRDVRQQPGRPNKDEMKLVSVRGKELALVREVYLYCHEIPLVFAHSVLNRRSLRGPWRMLTRQGARSLGAALFSNPKVGRTPLYFKKLNRHHLLYRRATRVLAAPPAHLWARRSVFLLQGKPILVTEVFLPQVLEL
ncbi:MAG: chorismate--pyruvate lyase family protein [Burkholderiales bacterium]